MTNVLQKVVTEVGPEIGAAAGVTAVIPDGSAVEQAFGTIVVAGVAYLIRKLFAWLTTKRNAAQSK